MQRPGSKPVVDHAPEQMRNAFRDVFLRNDSGTKVLSFLAAFWGFFDRSLNTEAKRVQRQCFMDLLIFCGVLADDTRDRMMQQLLGQPETDEEIDRVAAWIKSWPSVRTKRHDLEKGNQGETQT